jgi:hypothetical protein
MGMDAYEIPIEDQINHLRRNVMVHSVLYYRHDRPIKTDHEYDRLGKRLIEMQEKYPEESERVPYLLETFRNFTGTTSGFDLPLDDPYAQRTAWWLLDRLDKKEDEG